MGSYIQYRSTLCRKLKLTISPASPFQRILATLNAVRYKECRLTTEQVNYAVLELLNNSLRAHRTRGVQDPIHLHFIMTSEGLKVYLRDRGGGFDVGSLPYRLNENPADIDVHSTAFEEYRKRHGYARFGLGIYLAKKTFPFFSLNFLDSNGDRIEWQPDRTDGTEIILSTANNQPVEYETEDRRPTALESRSIYA